MSNSGKDILESGKKLPLMEEFYTLQGEGYHMGEAAYFVRIGGCDVGCSWCDSKESWNAKLFPPVPVEEVVKRAAQYPAKNVVVTGGEPSMYRLEYFTEKIHEMGLRCAVETSGAYKLTGNWDWICLSPKKQSPPQKSIFPRADELKVIIEKPEDFEWAEQNAALVSKECHLFLQPEWSVSKEISEIIAGYVMEHPRWRISLQAHKYIGIP
jgi:organic radical activating enzyme